MARRVTIRRARLGSLRRVARVKASPCALECRWLQTVRLRDIDGAEVDAHVAFGQVVGVHIDDRFIKDGLVDTAAMRPSHEGATTTILSRPLTPDFRCDDHRPVPRLTSTRSSLSGNKRLRIMRNDMSPFAVRWRRLGRS